MDYKERKQAFVSDLSGGGLWEINAVTLVAPMSVFVWSALQSRLSFFTPAGPTALATDFLLNVLAILAAATVYSSAPLLLNALLLSPAVVVLLGASKPQRSPRSSRIHRPRASRNGGEDGVKQAAAAAAAAGSAGAAGAAGATDLPVYPFLTTYRAAMMIITCVAILAVDFRVFPRRFAKTENWGTSLMDLGVGSFVFSGGVVSARAIVGKRSLATAATLARRLVKSSRHSIPLLVLGLIRLYSVKGLDYAEHVTEYGVHWNFFFTLGLLPPFVEIFHTLTARVPSYEALALGVAVLYQVALESTDLKSYILVSPRGPDLLSKNREGVFSFLGYLSIFLAGRATGLRVLLPRACSASGSPELGRRRVLASLGLLALCWSVLFLLTSSYAMGYGSNIPVSRRLANMPYVLWVCAFNNAQLLLFCLLETVFFPSVYKESAAAADAMTRTKEAEQRAFATSTIMAAFNRNGLAIFLVANLLTGAVNLAVPTIDLNTAQAMAILVGYAAVLTGIALGLDKLDLKLRL